VDECCGFGGTFSVWDPDVSAQLAGLTVLWLAIPLVVGVTLRECTCFLWCLMIWTGGAAVLSFQTHPNID